MIGSVDRLEGVLEGFMDDALADDYSATSADEGIGRAPARILALITFVVLGAILTMSLIATVRSTGTRTQTRDALAQRVVTAADALTQTQDKVDEERAQVAALQGRLLEESDQVPGIAAAVQSAGARTGTEPMSGQGVDVTLDDAPDAKAGSLNRVLDRDLQDVVNALWEAGAQGIAINGSRLVTTTAIRAAGDAIVVNYVPMTRPYRVTAVGGVQAAQGDSGLQALLAHLTKDYGLVSAVSTGDMALPAGEWHDARFAKPVVKGVAP